MRLLPVLAASAALFVASIAAQAADKAALLIGNEKYGTQPVVPGGDHMPAHGNSLRALGFEVTQSSRATSDALGPLLDQFTADAGQASQVVIALSGHFVNTGSTSWFLPLDAPVASYASLVRGAIPVDLVLDMAARHPGGAVVLLGMAGQQARTGPGVSSGLSAIDIPQGVAVVTGAPVDLAAFLGDILRSDGVSLAELVANSRRNVAAAGFLPADAAFIAPETPAGGLGGAASLEEYGEDLFWTAVLSIGTVDAIVAYLEKYPDGRYVAEASRQLRDLRDAPLRQAKEIEAAMALTRTQRQDVQRDLSLLGYDTRGIDGIWGQGTRAAISKWQGDSGFAATGFMDPDQVNQLALAAAERARELEEEARRKEEELRRQDTAYWNQTGRSGTEKGLRAYLKRYPDGLFSDVANTRLDAILAERRSQLQAAERRAWDNTVAQDTLEAYRAYLKQYPKGQFREAAAARIEELENATRNRATIEAAKAEEARMRLPGVTFVLIEQRLAKLGFEPGRIDGKLDDDARRAIRRFQRAAGLPVTGYLNNLTVVRLISG